jgi:hypothetical protein
VNEERDRIVGRRDGGGLAPDPFAVGTAMPDRREQALPEIAPHLRGESRMEE